MSINNTLESKYIDSVKTFDPRLDFDSAEERANAAIKWSSRSIEMVYTCINDGVKYGGFPFYRGKVGIRNANLVWQYTEEELMELMLCLDNINYFAENYVYLKAGTEVTKIKLRPYQKKLLAQYQKERFNIVLQARQTGKTTTTAIYLVWYTLFQVDKTVAILAQRASISGEIFDKVKGIIAALPFFMKPGVIKWGAEDMQFDNGCRIITRPLKPDCIQGYTVDVIFWDEVAYAKGAYEVWINIYPTLSSIPDSKIFLTSTPNGKNHFWNLWDGALRKKNKLVPFRVDYWEVPGRDAKWVEQESMNLGPEGFAQQYALSFDAKMKQLLKQDTVNFLSKVGMDWKGYQDMGTGFDDSFNWTQIFHYDMQRDYFVVSVDVSEGLGQDYSTIKIFKMMPKLRGSVDLNNPNSNFSLLSVGTFHNNSLTIKEFAYVIMRLMNCFDQERTKLIVERNQFGDELLSHMEYLADIHPDAEVEEHVYAKFLRKKDDTKSEKGIRVNKYTKRIGVKMFKKYVDDRMLIETDKQTIAEIREFGEDDKGIFRATTGHDDLVMPMVNLAYYIDQGYQEWEEFVGEFLDSLAGDTFFEQSVAANVEILNRINTKVTELIKAEQEHVGLTTDPDAFIYDAEEDLYCYTKEKDWSEHENSAGVVTSKSDSFTSGNGISKVDVDYDDNIYAAMSKIDNAITHRNIKQKIQQKAPMQEIIDYSLDFQSRMASPRRSDSVYKRDHYRGTDDSPESLMDLF